MGRGKIEIKRIENPTNRQVTYSKRKNGIIKKAMELTVLCDVKVSLIIFSSSGKMSEYCSPSTTLPEILNKYQTSTGKKLWDAKHERLSKELDRIKKENDRMQIELWHLKGEDIETAKHTELQAIEETLENGLSKVRTKVLEVFRMLKKNESMLEEENKRLVYILQQQMATEGNSKEAEIKYDQKRGEYNAHMPFAFRLQPVQPNLQDNK